MSFLCSSGRYLFRCPLKSLPRPQFHAFGVNIMNVSRPFSENRGMDDLKALKSSTWNTLAHWLQIQRSVSTSIITMDLRMEAITRTLICSRAFSLMYTQFQFYITALFNEEIFRWGTTQLSNGESCWWSRVSQIFVVSFNWWAILRDACVHPDMDKYPCHNRECMFVE